MLHADMHVIKTTRLVPWLIRTVRCYTSYKIGVLSDYHCQSVALSSKLVLYHKIGVLPDYHCQSVALSSKCYTTRLVSCLTNIVSLLPYPQSAIPQDWCPA